VATVSTPAGYRLAGSPLVGELLVPGSCGAWPEPGRACSGYLLEHDGFRVLLDLGYGTAGPLLAACPDGAVDAVIVTHAHPTTAAT